MYVYPTTILYILYIYCIHYILLYTIILYHRRFGHRRERAYRLLAGVRIMPLCYKRFITFCSALYYVYIMYVYILISQVASCVYDIT